MSTILKSKTDNPGPGFTGMVGFNLDDLASRASSELQQAQQQAQTIIQQAHQQAEAIRQQARDEGKADGLKDADAEVDSRVKVAVDSAVHSRLATLESAIDQLAASESQWLEQWQESTYQIALEIAHKIIGETIDENRQVIASWAAQALDTVRGAQSVVMAVHPETLSVLGQQLDSIARRPGMPTDIHIRPDENVEPMGVVVRREGGQIDMQLSTQFAQIARELNVPTDDSLENN